MGLFITLISINIREIMAGGLLHAFLGISGVVDCQLIGNFGKS